MEEVNIEVSRHAYQRMMERCGHSLSTAKMEAKKAYLYGKRCSDIKDKNVKKWLKKKQRGEVYQYFLRGGNVYIFYKNVLATVIKVPLQCKDIHKTRYKDDGISAERLKYLLNRRCVDELY